MSLADRLGHLRYRRYLDASIDGELTGEQARRVRAHLSMCPMCVRDEHTTLLAKRRLTVLGFLQQGALRRNRPEQ